jgi:hypothetical protein
MLTLHYKTTVMQPNLAVVIIVVVAAAALIGFLVYQNMKDEKEFEHDADTPVNKPHRGNDEERV